MGRGEGEFVDNGRLIPSVGQCVAVVHASFLERKREVVAPNWTRALGLWQTADWSGQRT